MNYATALAYLYEQLPMFHRIGKAAYKANLDNTHVLMELLGHPEQGLRCVHIAGTNGKGSTSHMLSSVLQEAGYRTGLYTSPHLKDFRERVRVNGAMISEEQVVRFIEEHREAFDAIKPSFFEWTVALAFDHFREERVDIAVIETGLGGRLDSTNVVTPEVSIVTNIGWDHADLLGGSLEAIAGEKAGIIKPGIPVVIGEASGAVAEVFRQKALIEEAPLLFMDHTQPLPYPIELQGAHQERNARTVLQTIDLLVDKGWSVSNEAVAKGLAHATQNTSLRGRWETIGQAPLTIVDVGHNTDGMRVVKEQLARTLYDRLHIVLGCVGDKDVGRFLAELPKAATYYFCKADIPRGLEAGKLREQAAAFDLSGAEHSSVAEAFHAARAAAGERDLVLVTGSVFVVAEVL